MTQIRYFIGIDPGVNTGVAVWDAKLNEFRAVGSMMLHEALEYVRNHADTLNEGGFIRVEDARQRKWFGKRSKDKQQGAGSIKRDSKIWEDFLTDLKFEFEMVAPKNNRTKMTSATFKRHTRWNHATNQHGRDAAMLVFKYQKVLHVAKIMKRGDSWLKAKAMLGKKEIKGIVPMTYNSGRKIKTIKS